MPRSAQKGQSPRSPSQEHAKPENGMNYIGARLLAGVAWANMQMGAVFKKLPSQKEAVT